MKAILNVTIGDTYTDAAGDMWLIQGFAKVKGEGFIVTSKFDSKDGDFTLFSGDDWVAAQMLPYEVPDEETEECNTLPYFLSVLRELEKTAREEGADLDVWGTAVANYTLRWLCQRHGQMGATVVVANMVNAIAGYCGEAGGVSRIH